MSRPKVFEFTLHNLSEPDLKWLVRECESNQSESPKFFDALKRASGAELAYRANGPSKHEAVTSRHSKPD